MAGRALGLGAAERSPQLSGNPFNLNRTYLRFSSPTFFAIMVLTMIPIVVTVGLSLTSLSYSSAAPTRFWGLRNYERLLEDDRFLSSIPVTLILILVPVAIQLLLGFVIALVMNERLPGMGWLRLIFVAPMVLPPIVMGLMWKVLFTPQLGGINYFLSLVGISGPSWLTDPPWALTAIIITALWGWTAFVALMFLTAMESFPTELYEAASIDGATWFQLVQHVTLPLLRPTAMVVLVFRVIEALAIFPIIFVVTNGGPAGATETVNYYAYVMGFNQLRVGYAAAIITVFFLLLVVLILPWMRSLVNGVQER